MPSSRLTICAPPLKALNTSDTSPNSPLLFLPVLSSSIMPPLASSATSCHVCCNEHARRWTKINDHTTTVFYLCQCHHYASIERRRAHATIQTYNGYTLSNVEPKLPGVAYVGSVPLTRTPEYNTVYTWHVLQGMFDRQPRRFQCGNRRHGLVLLKG